MKSGSRSMGRPCSLHKLRELPVPGGGGGETPVAGAPPRIGRKLRDGKTSTAEPPRQLERQKRIEMHQSEAARLMKERQDAVSEQISRKDTSEDAAS